MINRFTRFPKLEIEPEITVGDTVVTSMCDLAGRGRLRSVKKLVLTVTQFCVEGLGASASTVQIVESLVWPFVARRSLREEMFSDKEYRRFVSSMRETASRIHNVSSEDNREQTYCKYWLDSLLCQLFRDKQMPVRDDWNILPLFSGWCRSFLKRAIARRDAKLIYSLQKGSKQAWPPLGEIKLKQALDKHASRLSAEFSEVPREILNVIQEDSYEIFARTIERVNQEGSWQKFLPSSSACLQASRRNGGALGLVEPYNLDLESEDSRRLGKLRALSTSLNSWRQSTFDFVKSKALPRMDLESSPSMPALDIDIVAIPEPGKFRIISKGDGYLYSLLQPFQGVLLSAWKHHWASTMVIDLPTRVQEMEDCGSDLAYWCSVDYEAATDLLKKDASLAVLFDLPENPFSDMSLLSILRGRAKYPNGRIIDYTEGQLMGHPLSFPMLCAINLAVYHAALLRWREQECKEEGTEDIFRRMWTNVLVNGDDMLFKCPGSFYPVFLRTCKEVGFKISQGKNYLSRDFCMINSKVFQRSRDGTMIRHGYLNLRLVTGNNIKMGEGKATPVQIGKDINEMCLNCPWAISTIPACFSRWSRDWFGPLYRPNWFLPVHLGGFGIDPKYGPSTLRITRSQRELAARFVDDPKIALYRAKSLDIPTAKLAGAMARWTMVPRPTRPMYVDWIPENSSETITEEWLARLAYACQAHHGTIPVSDKVFVSKLVRSSLIRPRRMSMVELEKYREVLFFASHLPICPPLNYLKVGNLSSFGDSVFRGFYEGYY